MKILRENLLALLLVLACSSPRSGTAPDSGGARPVSSAEAADLLRLTSNAPWLRPTGFSRPRS